MDTPTNRHSYTSNTVIRWNSVISATLNCRLILLPAERLIKRLYIKAVKRARPKCMTHIINAWPLYRDRSFGTRMIPGILRMDHEHLVCHWLTHLMLVLDSSRMETWPSNRTDRTRYLENGRAFPSDKGKPLSKGIFGMSWYWRCNWKRQMKRT